VPSGITNSPVPWSRSLLEKLILAHLSKTLDAIYGKPKLIATYTTAHRLVPNIMWINPVHILVPFLRSVLILFSHPHLDVSSHLFF
jgi:hypothetical protein